MKILHYRNILNSTSSPKISLSPANFFVTETGNKVVVDHSGGLHVCINHGGTHKLKPPFSEVV